MKKFLKIMCLASLSILSAGSIFGIVYHQHNSNLVKREDKSVNDKDYEEITDNNDQGNNDFNDESDKENKNDDEKLIIDDKPENENINYDTKVEEKEEEIIAKKEFEDILDHSNKSSNEILENLISDTKEELTSFEKKAVYNEDKTICKEIGYFKNYVGEIVIERMPETVKEVPSELPWQINSLHEVFYKNKNTEIKNLEKWDLRFVRNMDGMFYFAESFNQNLNNWDTSNVVSMGKLFFGAKKFNQPLNNWIVKNVTNMTWMFTHAENFNQSLNSWDVSKVEDMEYMFSSANNFNQDLNNWDISNVVKLEGMFRYAKKFNKDISSWCLSKNVRSLSVMFDKAESFNNDDVPLITKKVTKPNGEVVTTWDVSNVVEMDYMFSDAKSFCQDISNWNVKKAYTKYFVNKNSGNWREPNWSKNLPKTIRDRYSKEDDKITH